MKASKEDLLIARRLREIREELFGSRGQASMARFLGLAPATYNKYEKASVRVPNKIINLLAETKGVNPAYLLCSIGPKYLRKEMPAFVAETEERYGPNLCMIPVLSEEVAVRPLRKIEDYPAEAYYPFPREFIKNPKDVFILKLDEDPVFPVIPAGVLVGVDISEREPQEGKVFVFRIEGRCLIRLLLIEDNTWILQPLMHAQKIRPIVLKRPHENLIVGKVCFVFRLL
ncbi:MAG TPA: S24 family peptidase [Candidatus Hypogeohydataceae bacterium YC41]